MGEYVIYNTNLPENPERKGNAQFSYLGVVLDSVYLLIQSLCTKFFHCTQNMAGTPKLVGPEINPGSHKLTANTQRDCQATHRHSV